MEGTQASSVSHMYINEQIVCLQMEIQDYKGLLQNASENTRQDIQQTFQCKEKMLAELQCKVQNTTDELLRSVRSKVPTEKMLAYQKEEVSKKEKRLISSYEQWKTQAREAREKLKSDITEAHMSSLVDILEKGKDDILRLYT